MQPPIPAQHAFVRSIHDQQIFDPFAWLESIEHPDTLPYLSAENMYTESRTEHLSSLRSEVLKELHSRTALRDQTAPYTVNGWTRFATIDKDESYWVYKRQAPNGAIEILLDENVRAQDKEYFDIDALQLNPVQTHMAWLEDVEGRERFSLYIQHLESKATFVVAHSNIKWTLAWLDDVHIVYVGGDHADRPCEVRLYNIHTQQDSLVWTEPDEHFHISVHRARVGNVVVCEAHSKTTSDVRLLAFDDGTNSWTLSDIQPRQHGVKYSVEVGTDHLYIRSNQYRREFSVYTQKRQGLSEQQPFWIPDVGTTIQSIELFSSHLVSWIRQDGLMKLHVHNLDTDKTHILDLPEPTYEIYPDVNPHFDSPIFRLRYTSPIQPDIVLAYTLETAAFECIHRFSTPNYTKENYTCDRIWATSHDGTKIPISIVEHREHRNHVTAPLLLVGYGAYGVSYDVGFQSHWVSLLDRGFRIAIAHIRGGGELGREWYNQGKGQYKQNSFSDFIAAAELLISDRYTTPAQLIATGGSAGGLLMGACLNQRPELFGGCVAEVPFVDVTNTMLNPDLPLTIIEYEEWGNPNNVDEYSFMSAYDPYLQYNGQPYPSMLITGGLHDPRVGYWEPAKWMAKICTLHPDSQNILLRMNMTAGHSGSSGRLGMLEEDAWAVAFMIDTVNQAVKV